MLQEFLLCCGWISNEIVWLVWEAGGLWKKKKGPRKRMRLGEGLRGLLELGSGMWWCVSLLLVIISDFIFNIYPHVLFSNKWQKKSLHVDPENLYVLQWKTTSQEYVGNTMWTWVKREKTQNWVGWEVRGASERSWREGFTTVKTHFMKFTEN